MKSVQDMHHFPGTGWFRGGCALVHGGDECNEVVDLGAPPESGSSRRGSSPA